MTGTYTYHPPQPHEAEANEPQLNPGTSHHVATPGSVPGGEMPTFQAPAPPFTYMPSSDGRADARSNPQMQVSHFSAPQADAAPPRDVALPAALALPRLPGTHEPPAQPPVQPLHPAAETHAQSQAQAPAHLYHPPHAHQPAPAPVATPLPAPVHQQYAQGQAQHYAPAQQYAQDQAPMQQPPAPIPVTPPAADATVIADPLGGIFSGPATMVSAAVAPGHWYPSQQEPAAPQHQPVQEYHQVEYSEGAAGAWMDEHGQWHWHQAPVVQEPDHGSVVGHQPEVASHDQTLYQAPMPYVPEHAPDASAMQAHAAAPSIPVPVPGGLLPPPAAPGSVPLPGPSAQVSTPVAAQSGASTSTRLPAGINPGHTPKAPGRSTHLLVAIVIPAIAGGGLAALAVHLFR